MGPLGWQETVFLFVLALVLFGPKKLPELGKTVGKALTEFRRASSELKATFDREMHQIERENESLVSETSKHVNEINQSYDYTYYDSEGYGNDPYSYDGYSNPDTASTSTVGTTETAGAEVPAEPQTLGAGMRVARGQAFAQQSEASVPAAAEAGPAETETKA